MRRREQTGPNGLIGRKMLQDRLRQSTRGSFALGARHVDDIELIEISRLCKRILSAKTPHGVFLCLDKSRCCLHLPIPFLRVY